MAVIATCPKCGLVLTLTSISPVQGSEKKEINKISDLPPGYKARCLDCNELEMKMEEK